MTGAFSKTVTAFVLGAAVSSLSPGPAAGRRRQDSARGFGLHTKTTRSGDRAG